MSKIIETKDYSKFVSAENNRAVGRHPKLMESMRDQGWVGCPILVTEREDGKLVIQDGQHRFENAKALKMAVKYEIYDGDINIAMLNNAQKRWSPRDYVSSFVRQGKQEYIKLSQFCDRWGVPMSIAAGLLRGISGGGDGVEQSGIREGTFKVRDHAQAVRVMEIIEQCSKSTKTARNRFFIEGLARCLMVPEFDSERFVHVVQKNPAQFKPQANIEEMLQIFEDEYNRQCREKIPLRFMAQNAAKARKENASRKQGKLL